jgi:hypothetical protein
MLLEQELIPATSRTIELRLAAVITAMITRRLVGVSDRYCMNCGKQRGRRTWHAIPALLVFYYLNDRKLSRSSTEKDCGCSHAAKWPPFIISL